MFFIKPILQSGVIGGKYDYNYGGAIKKFAINCKNI